MSATVTAHYDSREEAGLALKSLDSEVSLAHADIYDGTPAGLEALRRLDLTAEERTACEAKLATGGFLLLAQAQSGEDAERIIAALERIADEHSRVPDAPSAPAAAAAEQRPAVVEEERLPVVEEELRVGTREVVRGGARVRTRVEEVPVTEEVELIEEFARIEKRPASRPVSEQELEETGLLRERVFEVAQFREEPVVSKEAFVREEVVVSKTIERRVEQIHETVRRTEVVTEELGAEPDGERRKS
jgi:stress response protein YsnF